MLKQFQQSSIHLKRKNDLIRRILDRLQQHTYLMASSNLKQMFRLSPLSAALTALVFAVPAFAYYFQGYYCPQVLISPMRDDQMYTPVGAGVITSKAGFRVHPVTGKADFHSGVDLGAHLNDRVYNLLDGIVTRVGWRGALGVAVEVYHPYPNYPHDLRAFERIFGYARAIRTARPCYWLCRVDRAALRACMCTTQ